MDHEGNVIDDEAKDAEQDAEDTKELSQPIKFTILGSSDCPVSPEDESIDFAMSYRIPKIEGLEACTKLTVSRSLLSLTHVFLLSISSWAYAKI